MSDGDGTDGPDGCACGCNLGCFLIVAGVMAAVAWRLFRWALDVQV